MHLTQDYLTLFGLHVLATVLKTLDTAILFRCLYIIINIDYIYQNTKAPLICPVIDSLL